MKARSAALAIAALVLWLIPSGSLAQGKSGKSRLTICHVPPGNPDAGKTMTVSEQAWGAHEAHGDYLGPCEGYSEGSDDEYGDDAKRAKKGKKGKKKEAKRARRASDTDAADDDTDADAADDDTEADDRADEGEEAGATDSGSGETDEADVRTRRAQRQAERRAQREQRIRDRDGQAADDADAAEAEAGADTATDDTQAAQRRARREAARDERRAARAAETEAAPEAEPGFFSGMKQFFGFGGDEAGESSGEAVE